MFVIDGSKSPTLSTLEGRGGEVGLLLASAHLGEAGKDERIFGSNFNWGSTGMASLGEGLFYFSHNGAIKEEKSFFSNVKKYRFNPKSPEIFDLV